MTELETVIIKIGEHNGTLCGQVCDLLHHFSDMLFQTMHLN
jgi:hypothetical protein